MVTETSKFGNAKTPEPLQIEQFQTPRLKDNRLACALGYVRIFSDDVIITWWRHQVGHHFSRFLRNLHYFKLELCPEGVINSEIRIYHELDNHVLTHDIEIPEKYKFCRSDFSKDQMYKKFSKELRLVSLWIFKFSQISARGVFGCADSEYQLEIPDFGHWRALARTRRR